MDNTTHKRAQVRAQRSEYVSVQEAAEHTGFCTKTIRRYISDGRIPGYRVGPRAIRVNLDDLDALFSTIPAGEAQ